jgi:hypothetical protein
MANSSRPGIRDKKNFPAVLKKSGYFGKQVFQVILSVKCLGAGQQYVFHGYFL